jgi:hypothetical protein
VIVFLPDGRECGALESTVRFDVRELGRLTGGVQRSLAEAAYVLARSLDEGAGMSAAAINRELRATLDDLVKGAAGDDDDDLAGLATAVDGPAGPDVPAPLGDATFT